MMRQLKAVRYWLILVATIMGLHSYAQTYPYRENFEQQPTNQIPTGWQGDMKVKLAHGVNDSKALSANLSGSNLMDSAISTLAGPITNYSRVSFFYTIINDDAFFPSTPTTLKAGGGLEVFITNDGQNYQSLMLIDSSNHLASLNFAQPKIPITQFAGDTVRFKFVCRHGSGVPFFIDIDSIRVIDDPTIGVEEVDGAGGINIFPNPCGATGCYIQAVYAGQSEVTVFDLAGRNVFTATALGNELLNMPQLGEGMYVVCVKQQAAIYTKKLVIR